MDGRQEALKDDLTGSDEPAQRRQAAVFIGRDAV
jgi:hypothetical protein